MDQLAASFSERTVGFTQTSQTGLQSDTSLFSVFQSAFFPPKCFMVKRPTRVTAARKRRGNEKARPPTHKTLSSEMSQGDLATRRARLQSSRTGSRSKKERTVQPLAAASGSKSALHQLWYGIKAIVQSPLRRLLRLRKNKGDGSPSPRHRDYQNWGSE